MKSVFKRLFCLVLVLVFVASFGAQTFAEPMNKDEVRALNDWPNWVASSCSTSPSTEPQAATGSVYMLGDSTTLRASTEIEKELTAKGFTPKINASVGRSIKGKGTTVASTTSGLEAIEQDQAFIKESSVVVIALGANTENNFSGAVKELIEKVKLLNPDLRIYWSNTFSGPNKQTVNQVISNQSRALGFTVIDFASKSIPLDTSDNIHQKIPEGNTILAKTLSDSLSAPPPTSEPSVDIKEVVEKYGLQSVSVQKLKGGAVAGHNADEPPAGPASTLKLVIVDVLLRGEIDLNKKLTVSSDLFYGNTNDLGTTSITIKAAIEKTLGKSSNVGANVLIKELGGPAGFTAKARNAGYTNTTLKGYYDPSSVVNGKSINSSTVNEMTSAMNHLFSESGSGYDAAQAALIDASLNNNQFGVAGTSANKWGGTSSPAISSDVALFDLDGDRYVIGLYINEDYLKVDDKVKNAMKDLVDTITSGGPSAQNTCACVATTLLSGEDNPEKIWNFFISKGLSDAQTAGIMGNIQQESGFDPQKIEGGAESKDPNAAGSGGYGLVQWTPGSKLLSSLKTGKVEGEPYDLSVQLEMVWKHMQNEPPITTGQFKMSDFKKIKQPRDAAIYFGKHIEGFGVEGPRNEYAVTIMEKYSGKAGGATASSESGGCGGSGSPNCTDATGTEKIICEAKKYDDASYSQELRPHSEADLKRRCLTVNSSCYQDCSSLVSSAVFDAFGTYTDWTTFSIMDDSANWEKISYDELKPGDILLPHSSHVEIVDSIQGNEIKTFGAHTSNKPQKEQVGPSSYTKKSSNMYYRYVGEGL